MLEQSRIDGILAKAANVASPRKELFKLASKAVAEFWLVERRPW
jgi:hypothetical protein